MPKVQLHLGRYPTLPTVDEIVRMVTALTGKPPTAEDVAEALRIRDAALAVKGPTPPPDA